MDPNLVPGFPQAHRAVTQLGGLLLGPDAAASLALVALAAAAPAMKAELLADIADDLAALAGQLPPGAGPLAQVAESLDKASYEIRRQLQ